MSRLCLLTILAGFFIGVGPAHAQEMFASPDKAVKALQTALQNKNQAALNEIFGPAFEELMTGDKVQDTNNEQKFSALLAKGYALEDGGNNTLLLEAGNQLWPMPIPLTKSGDHWYFNTASGKDEIINRHIGKDELYAIGVCHAYIAAQKQYAAANAGAYAHRFKSSRGKRNGLYWPTRAGETSSPFSALVAQAQAEGYFLHHGHKGPHPFHGYYFRVLPAGGANIPAMIAYPVYWAHSGVMTFIVDENDKVYQQNWGEGGFEKAQSINTFDPSDGWTAVTDEGIPSS